MSEQAEIISMLREEFSRWQSLLAGLSEEQITAPQLSAGLSIKDVMAHLWMWQQRTIARLEAALNGRLPQFHGWPTVLDPESEEDIDQVNAWIYNTTRDKPWSQLYGDWRAGYLRFMDLVEMIPESDLLTPGRCPWLDGAPLSVVVISSYDHHHEEHLEPLAAWLRQNSDQST